MRLVKDNARRLASIIAIAVIGETYYTKKPIKKPLMNSLYQLKLKELTDLFMHTIKPSKLLELIYATTGVSNLPDFYISMRILSGARQTLPRKESIE